MNRSDDVLVQTDVEIELRDGVVTRADVYRPAHERPVPAVLLRTPYDKSALRPTMFHGIDPVRTARSGFACVLQDVRGRHTSDGTFEPYVHEEHDGFDSVEWVAAQAWCTARVGMTGASYSGLTQLLAAAARPPSLAAIVPMVVGSRLDEGWTYVSGVPQLGFLLTWTLTNLAPDLVHRAIAEGRLEADALERLYGDIDDLPAVFPGGARQALPALKELDADFLAEWLAHPTGDAYWHATSVERRWDDITVPALHVGGWFDPFLAGTIANYRALQARRGNQRLVIGPWTHGSWAAQVPGLSFGARGERDVLDLDGLQLRHFAEHLSDEGDDLPSVQSAADATVFVLGRDRWTTAPAWPRAAHVLELYASASGELAAGAPPAGESMLRHDPADPSPTLGGPTFLPGADVAQNAGPRDHAAVCERRDVMVHLGAPLEDTLTIDGPVRAVVVAQSAASSFDVVVRLLDAHPDGRLMLLAEGIARARGGQQHRHIGVEVGWLAAELAPGHRVAMAVTTASFPRFDPLDTATEMRLCYGSSGTRLRLPTIS